MKGKSLVSFLAVVFILGALVIFLKLVSPGIGKMDEEGWMMLLGVLGVSLAIVALVIKENSNKEKDKDDVVEPSDELQLKHNELKLQELHKSGILTEAEYQQKLADARLKSGGYKKTIESLKALLDAGLLTEEEFERKSNEAYEKSKANSTARSKEEENDSAEKVVKLMELREAELITQEEFEEQMAKI